MKDKVTSYEISKRLAELGFEAETHCGWWDYVDNGDHGNQPWFWTKDDPSLDMPGDNGYKAYDCP